MDVEGGIGVRYDALKDYLDERQRRLLVGAEAKALGVGGISRVSAATGVSRRVISVGLSEVEGEAGEVLPPGRIRRPGGGRKREVDRDPALLDDLLRLIDPATRGDPESPLRWTCKSTYKLAEELKNLGHQTSSRMVGDLLKANGFSLQANSKTKETASHPDRDGQFQYINERVTEFLGDGQPVISVDSKKKELVGDFKNAGREWHPKGQPEKVRVYDFKDPVLGRVNPYGVYDVTANQGWVNVGTDHDTAAFAVHSIRRWWESMGIEMYPDATHLLITADGGGSNGSRVRLWKVELQRLANDTGLDVHICHLPPGTSKWNKIEHRLFSHISQNWRGRPLTSHEVVVNLIANTTTSTGLKVRAELDKRKYPSGLVIPKKELEAINMTRDAYYGNWNYIIAPQDEIEEVMK